MKRIINLIFLFLCIPLINLLVACNNDIPSSLKKFDEITFQDAIFDYDQEEKELKIDGILPEGALVTYLNNKATNAGVYNAQAVIELEGYETLTLKANLTINKINYNMSGIEWDYVGNCFKYDGNEKSVHIKGNLPEGVNIKQYINNTKTDAGQYIGSVVFNYDKVNYNEPKISDCSWEIKKANLTNIAFENYETTYTGGYFEILISGDIPSGVVVSYVNNRGREVGEYVAQAILSGKNYETLILNAKLTISQDFSNFANKILSDLLKIPNPWDFLPNSFSVEHKLIEQDIDFSTFVSISDIPKNLFGKQMDVVYYTLIDAEEIVQPLESFYGFMNVVVDFYQTFINDNKDNYAQFSKSTDDYSFDIELSDRDYVMNINYSLAEISLRYNLNDRVCFGTIKLTNSNMLKYEISQDKLILVVNIADVYLTKISFERTNNIIYGNLFEFYGNEESNIKTSALIYIDNSYTSIISNKRESDDLKIEGYMEVYDNSTGYLIAAEVKETISNINYDTKWFNLYDISNINTIKVINKQNVLNKNTIYINNNENAIKTKLVGGFSVDMGSRRFDIEMKELYGFKLNRDTNKYEKMKIEIPMMFVQSEFVDSFSVDFYDSNAKTGAINPTNISIKTQDYNFFILEYDVLISSYINIKTSTNYSDLKDYLK